MGKAVNTNRMKSTWKKRTRENYAKWKVTKCKRVGADPAFLPGHSLPGHPAVRPWCSVLWHYAAASQDLSCFRAWGWAPTQQCSSLWIWINSQKSKNCGISPLNAVPREGVLSLSQYQPTPMKNGLGRCFPRSWTIKYCLVHKTPLLWDLPLKSSVFTSLLKSRWF